MTLRRFLLFTIFSVLSFLRICAQEGAAEGIVVDKTGEVLIGVQVRQVDTDRATVTDLDGHFNLPLDSKAAPSLRFSYVGMEEKVMRYTGKSMKVLLLERNHAMEEVVVVAYGTRKKGTITGSVSTVNGEAVSDAPVASFDQALQGKATGLTVLQNSGDPSAAATFYIRGTNSINAGTDPLFIVDGVPVSSSEFNAINPGDIESFSVLKDASSTSIYGARAANGVVVITTKRGKMGDKAQIKLRGQYGFSNLAFGHWSQMNTSERLDFEEMIGVRVPGQYDRETLEKTNINWKDLVFRDNAPTQSYDLSVAGAVKNINYYLSAGYMDQQGTAIDSRFTRYTLRSNIELQANDWLKMGTNTSLTYSLANEADYGSYSIITPISASKFMLPYWDPFKSDGTYTSPSDGTWRGSYENPLEWVEANPLERTRMHVLSSTFLELEPIADLRLKTLLGIDGGDTRTTTSSKPSYVGNYGMGTVGKSFVRAYNLTWTNTATYSRDFKEHHHLNLLLGHEMTRNASDAFSVVARGQSNDQLLTLSTGTVASNWNDATAASTYLSLFGRAEYSFYNRFYGDLSVRRDASSKFGKDARWATFWSIGGMWDIRKEKWLKPASEWLTNLQLSASYGTSGNSSIPNYDHLSLYAAGPQYAGMPGIAPYSRGNEKLTWEKLSTFNLAFKAGLWDRVDFSVEFYNKKTTDMLMEVPVTLGNGFTTQWDNIGGMLNRGVELDLHLSLLHIRKFQWDINANASYNHNEITELYDGLDEYEIPATGLLLKVGHPYGEHYLVRYAGVNPVNGDAMWYDKNGQVTNVYNEEDKVLSGKSYMAPWQGGFGTTLSWNGLSLDMQFSWVQGRWMLNNDRWFDESNGLYSSAYNQSRELINCWKQPGDITTIPRYGVSPEMDSHLLEDGSFLRLKNVMLSYALPKPLLKRSKLVESTRFFLQAQNLLTFTKFTGMDPESSSNVYQATYPMSRQFTIGAEISF